MKMKLLIIAVLSLCLLLAVCEQTRRTPPPSPNQPEASQPTDTGEGQGEPAMENPEKAEEGFKVHEENLEFQTVSLSWENQAERTLTLQVDVPYSWSVETNGGQSIDQSFNDTNGMKIAGSFGIVKMLEEGESLLTLKNPGNLPTSILESQIVLIGNKEFLLEKANLSDPLRPELFVYHYCFEENGAVINFYFYNDSNDPEKNPLYETILSSIQIAIS